MSTLTIITQALAFEDAGATSNPSQRPIDWKRSIAGLPVENPSTESVTVEPMGSETLVDGSRATTIDGTTEFSLSLSPLDPNRYRITHTGGTTPGFRTARTVPVDGVQLTLTVNANQSLSVVAGSGTPFAAVQAGDVVFLPGVSTGDTASPFNTLNLGRWTVLARTNTSMTLARPTGETFEGASEVVTPTDDTQLQVFSTAGVQVGETVELAAGFASSSLRAYDVLAVTASWIEVYSTVPLGAETGVIPGASGLLVYTTAKRFIQLEVDQECVVRLNGDTGNSNRLTPWIAGDKSFPAEFKKVGPVWKLVVVNRTNVPVKVLLLSAE
jgi:hypothetical protein